MTTNPTAELPLLVPSATDADDPRPVLAELVGADYSGRALTPQRSDLAPNVVRAALPRFAPWDARHGTDVGGAWRVRDHGDAGARTAATWDAAFEAIRVHAERAHADGRFVVGLGGDHSVSWPLVVAARDALRARRPGARIGIVQLDVHHDVRSLEHGPSNGTPVRGLVESGVVDPADIVQLGIHPFANRRALTQYCDEVGIRRVSLDDIARDGAAAAARAALDALAHVDALYLTVDIDVLDRSFAPGTGAALPGGLDPRTLVQLVEAICDDPRTMAMDVVEFDPERDVASCTAYNVAHVVVAALASLARRTSTAGTR